MMQEQLNVVSQALFGWWGHGGPKAGWAAVATAFTDEAILGATAGAVYGVGRCFGFFGGSTNEDFPRGQHREAGVEASDLSQHSVTAVEDGQRARAGI